MFRQNILDMAGYTPGEQLNDPSIIKLNTNENPYPASEAVTRAVEETVRAGLQKYPSAMATPFREKAGEVLGVDPDWILCGNGSDDILTICTRAMVGPGELLRLPKPSYILYKTLGEIQDARSEEVLFDDAWDPTDRFAEPSDNLRLAFLPNPNSPSGTVVSRERILELADRLPCPLVVDEAYADFAELNCLDLVAEHEKIMVSRTFSKSYALAGLRFGFLVAQPHLIRELVKVKDSYNCDSLSIAAATAAIGDQQWLVANRNRVIATRTRLTAAMRELGFDVIESHANFTWNTHPTLALKPIYEHLKAHKILVRHMVYDGWGEGLRISVGTDEQTDTCVARIAEYLQN